METKSDPVITRYIVSGVTFFIGFATLVGLNIFHNINNILGWFGIVLMIFGCVNVGMKMVHILEIRSVEVDLQHQKLAKRFQAKCLNLLSFALLYSLTVVVWNVFRKN